MVQKNKKLFWLLIFLFIIIIFTNFAYTFELRKDLDKPINPKFQDLPPTINISADSYNVNTTVTITAIATDSGNNAGLVWIKIYENGTESHKYCNNQQSCIFVKSFTHNNPGVYEYYAKAKDLGNNIVTSQKIYVIFNGLNHPPIITSYIPTDLTPEVNENSSLYFEVQASDPDGDPLTYKFKLDGEVVSNTNNFTYNPGFFDAGNHEVIAIVSDNKGGIATKLWNVTVINVLIPTSCNLSFNPPSPIYYNQQPFIAYCSCDNPEANEELWRDNINVTDEIGKQIILAAKPSGYLYVCNVSETENYASASNQSIYIINKASPLAHLALNGIENDLQVIYGTQTNATGWVEINQGIENALLLRNGTVVASGSPATEINILPAGIYNYTFYYPESQNYTSETITRFLTVLSGETILNLTAYPSWNIVYGDIANISCSANNNEVLINLYRNNQLITSGYGIVYDFIDPYELAAGNYLYVCNTTGSQNYTSASVENTLIINKAQTNLSLNALPSWNVIYGTQTNVSCYANHNQAQINLYRNNQLVSNPDIAVLAAGNYLYVCNISESENYTSATKIGLLQVNKANTYIILLLNGINGDISVNISDIVNANASLNIGFYHSQPPTHITNKNEDENLEINRMLDDFTVYLYINGTPVASGEWNVLYNTSFNQSGVYNFTAYFHGNENYTSSYATHFVYVIPDTQPPFITFIPPTPENGSIINVNHTLIRVNVSDNLAIHTVWLEFDGENETMIPEWKYKKQYIILEENKIYYLNKTNLSNGWHWFRAYANDTSGNVNSTEQRFIYINVTYDNEPPTINILSPENITYYTNIIDLNYTVYDNIAIDSCWYNLDYSQNISLPNCQNTTISVNEGNHYLIVYANDTSGNIGYDDVYFSVTSDNEPPNLTIHSPLNITYTTNEILINITANDNVGVDSIWYSIDNQPNVTYINPIYQTFSDGIHILEAWANDTSGNIGYDYVMFTVNTTIPDQPPIINLIAPPNESIDTDGNVTIIYNVTDDIATSLICYIFSNTSGQWQSDATQIVENGSINSYDYIDLNDGYYIWNVECFDGSNYNFAIENWSFIVNKTIPDIYPPIIEFIPPTPENGSIINTDWVYINVSIIDNVAVAYALLEWNNVNETLPNVMPNIYSVNKTNLIDGIYNYKVYAVDTAGNWNVSEERIVIINTSINNPPIVELIWPDDGYIHNSTNITLRFYVEDDFTNLLDCYLYTNISGEWQQTNYTQAINATINEFNLTNLENNVYLWNVECSDGSLSSFANQNRTFIINVIHDVGVDDSYSNSVNGIRIIDSESGNIIIDDPANLIYGKNYTIRARIKNYGDYPENVRIIIKIVNETQEFVLSNYTTIINQWHYAETTFNTSDYEIGSYYVIVNVDLIGYIDQNLSNNERNRSFNIIMLIDLPPYWKNEFANPPSPTIYGSGPYNFSIEWYDDYGVNKVIFEFNGNEYIPTCNQSLPANYTLCYYTFDDLAAGIYEYRWYANDTINQSNSTSLIDYIINKAQSNVNLLLNGNDNDINIKVNESVNISCYLINPISGYIEIYENSSIIASGPSPISILKNYSNEGLYNITCLYPETQNYTSSFETHFINVTPIMPGEIHLLLNGIEGNLTTSYDNNPINITAYGYGNISIYLNGSLIGQNENYVEIIKNIAAGYYNVTAYSSGDENHSATSISYYLTILKANSSIILLLNGSDSDITIFTDETVNHTAILINPPSGNVKILLNGSEMASGNSPLVWINTYHDPGYYNVTAIFEGNENYSESSSTHFINVIPVIHDIAIQNINYSKWNTTVYNNDSINITAELINLGDVNETNVNITLYNSTGHVLAYKIIPLIQPNEIINVNFTWIATAPENSSQIHTLQIYAMPLPGETNLSNNGQIINIEVWHACGVIDCSVFRPYTQYDNYTLGQPFIVRTILQNAWSNKNFYDFPVKLEVSEGLQIIGPWPQLQHVNIPAGSFVLVNWNVTSNSTGNKTLTTIAGNNDYSASKNITILQ
ncbi:MAG: hypothetical protein QXM27_00190 [Candidatus Pacearchaeota archaeon]